MSDNRTVTKAATFLDSIGINTKGSTYLDGYKNSSLIIESLDYIGVTKVRDSLAEYGKSRPVLDAMADAGIQFDFRVTYTLPAKGELGIQGHLEALKVFMAEHPGSVVSIEGVNEANLNSVTYHGETGLKAAIAFQRDLYTAVKADPALATVQVVNLSLAYDDTVDYATIGDLGAYSDAANAHTYTHTGKIADTQMEATLNLARGASKGDPLIVTETGHTTLKSEAGIGTTETAQAKLLLSNLLLAFENGAQTTYLYELLDNSSSASRGPKEVHFGIFNEDGTPKAAATALHNLNAILSYGDDGSAGAAPKVDYTLSGAPANTHSMLMGKSGGVYDLVVWADMPVFDDATDRDIVNPAKQVTVDLGKVEGVIRVYDPLGGLEPIATFQNVREITIPLSDRPLVIEVGATSAVKEQVASVAPALQLSADDFVSQMGSLADAAGLKTVKLTDTHVLAVSSVETMTYMIKTYAPLLAKIEGGFSFEITYGEATWRKVQTFDAAGKLTLQTDYGLKDGVVSSKVVYNADGSRDSYNYGITDQSYATIHQKLDAAGKLVLIERFAKDGTILYGEARQADNSKTFSYYDAKGQLTTRVDVAADGTNSTLTYDPATKKLVQQVVKEPDGDVLTTRYTDGAKTLTAVTSHEGWKQQVTFDAKSGAILVDYTVKADGSATNKTYVAGVLTKVNTKNADGTFDNWAYKITGQRYVSEHQVSDAAGKLTLIERFAADGSTVSTETRAADGSKTFGIYNSAGKLVNDVTVAADGTNTTLAYDPATKALLSKVVTQTNGDILTTRYTNGAKTLTAVESHEGWKQQVTYDGKTGAILVDYTVKADGSATNKTYAGGVLTKVNTKNADGTLDNWTYKITGQSYVTEHQVNDASGKVTLIERLHEDGTFDTRELRGADGSKQYSTYNAAGKLLSQSSVTADGSTTALTYDAATAKLVLQIVKQTGGDVLTTKFTDGAKSVTNLESREGWKQQTTFDAKTGTILSEYTTRTDGSATNKTYVEGVLSKVNTKNADGSLDNWAYKLTGKSYATEHQATDASGKLTLIERMHEDGTFDYREVRAADGSKEIVVYSKTGAVVTDTTVKADGSKIFENHLQDGSGDVWIERSDAAGTLQTRNIVHSNGQNDVYSFSNAQTLVGTSGNDTFYFRTTSDSKMVYGGGNDTVLSFDGNDKIAIGSDWAAKFADLDIAQKGQDVLIRFDDHNSITLKYAKVADLHSSYFLMS